MQIFPLIVFFFWFSLVGQLGKLCSSGQHKKRYKKFAFRMLNQKGNRTKVIVFLLKVKDQTKKAIAG